MTFVPLPNQPPALLRVLGIAIEDQISLGTQRARLRISLVARHLKHRGFVRSGSDARNLHNAIGKADHKQDNG
jgi:hypothetical protein